MIWTNASKMILAWILDSSNDNTRLLSLVLTKAGLFSIVSLSPKQYSRRNFANQWSDHISSWSPFHLQNTLVYGHGKTTSNQMLGDKERQSNYRPLGHGPLALELLKQVCRPEWGSNHHCLLLNASQGLIPAPCVWLPPIPAPREQLPPIPPHHLPIYGFSGGKNHQVFVLDKTLHI